jgi:hypothetical protein
MTSCRRCTAAFRCSVLVSMTSLCATPRFSSWFATVWQSNPFEHLECLGQFGSHNPLVLAPLGLWGVIIPVRQRAPPMRLAIRKRNGSVIQPFGDTVSQCAILGVDSSIGDITKFLCQLDRRNSVVGRSILRQEHGQFCVGHAYRLQGRLELFDRCDGRWVTVRVHIAIIPEV